MFLKADTEVRYVPNTTIVDVGEKSKTTIEVEKFYSPSPFPNYNDEKTLADLNQKLEKNDFLKALKNQIGLNKKVIEVGSGTCQLSLVLSYGTNNLNVAFDPTLKSIALGEAFANKNELQNCKFVVGDLFDDPFREEFFDYVWCSGVLHHTENPRKGFGIICRWLKKDGYIIVGLYNRFGRLRTAGRQWLWSLLGKGKVARYMIYKLDPILRGRGSVQQKTSWFRDQYEHPVESCHTISEVLRWFETENIEYISSIPSSNAAPDDFKSLFVKQDAGTWFSRLISELLMIFGSKGGEGGLFIVIGKKRLENKSS
tara:strand:+ start:2006 stop:2944 length:939 start_codon:yes stop_codon:yes gene_type:complete